MTNHAKSVTLIELVIVLIILLALAGIGITFYPDLSTRANLVGALTTLNELNNNFQLIEIMAEGGITDTGAIPDDLDLLTDIIALYPPLVPPTEGIRTAVLADFFGPPVVFPAPFVPDTFTTAEIAELIDGDGTLVAGVDLITAAEVEAAFVSKGVNSFAVQVPVAPFNVTFDYDITATTGFEDFGAISAGAPEFFALTATAGSKLGLEVVDPVPVAGTPIPVYIVLGVGASARHIGEAPGLMEAPVYVTEIDGPPTLITGLPDGTSFTGGILETDVRDFYSRFMVIYKISAASTGSTSTVNIDFVKCVVPHPIDGLIAGDDLLLKIYSLLD